MSKKLTTFVLFILLLDVALLNGLFKWRPHLQLHMLDVGQGDGILLVTPEQHHILIDGGPGNSVLMQMGQVMALPFNTIDLMVLTHPHMDHMEGLISVLDRMEVEAILLSAPAYENPAYEVFLEKVQAEGAQIFFAEADTDFQLGSLHLDVLFPFESKLGEEMENINNASPVIRASDGEVTILLEGDAEMEVEAEILAQYKPEELHANILKAGHHGSRTSSTEAYLDAVEPEWMLISCGAGNTYKHPHPETLEKAEDRGIQVFRTDLEGRISIIFDDYSWTRRILAPKLWSFSSSRS